ncbi:MAG: FAD binding domain-containing protein [Nitriliruptoraceae bacterium]
MKPSPFAYHRPDTTDDAVRLLAEVDGAKVLAGGQSLVPLMNMRLAAPSALVDISRLDDVSGVEVDDEVRIGAAVTHQQLLDDDRVRRAAPLVAAALAHVAHPVIRHRGTTVGSIVHADPAAEMPAVLVLLEGAVELTSTRGTRRVAARDFFIGPLESAIEPDELAVAAFVPRTTPRSGTAIAELARRHGDYALAGVVARVELDTSGAVASAHVACIGTDAVPTRHDLTAELAGQRPDALSVDAAVDHLRSLVDPDDDIHASADYRRHLVGVLAGQVLATAANNATVEGAHHG